MDVDNLKQPEELKQALSTPLTESQKLKTGALQRGLEMQSLMTDSLQLEQRRAVALHGDNSAPARNVNAMIAAHKKLVALTRIASGLVLVSVPAADPHQFIVYGVVTNSSGKPISNATVSAVDDNQTVIQSTDVGKDGSYVLRIGPVEDLPLDGAGRSNPVHHAESNATARKSPKSRSSAQASRSKRIDVAASQSNFGTLHIVATDEKLTYRQEAPDSFQFQAGKLAYVKIVVQRSQEES